VRNDGASPEVVNIWNSLHIAMLSQHLLSSYLSIDYISWLQQDVNYDYTFIDELAEIKDRSEFVIE